MSDAHKRFGLDVGESRVDGLGDGVYAVTIGGNFSVDVAARAMQAIELDAGLAPFAVIYVVGERYEGYDASLRTSEGPHLRARATAVVTDRSLLRMVVSSMGLATALKGKALKGFDDLETARRWCLANLGPR